MSAIPITLDALINALTIRDLTDPAQGPHAMQLLVDAAVASLQTTAIHLEHTSPVVLVDDNYDRLGYADDTVARDSWYTRYISDSCMLRGHTSAGVPSALRRLAAQHETADDVLVALPGICHRRDAIDRLHTGSPHQLDLWRLQRNSRRLDSGDLAEMVDTVLTALLPGRTWRWTPARHPYTLEGRQIDVIDDGQLIEVAECGLAAPTVLAVAGLDTRQWSGLALGIGLDRILMLRKGIPDIRLLRSTDPRITSQMLDLSPYRSVSDLPPARRDLSVAVTCGSDAETMGDRIRDALSGEAELVEEVAVLAITPYEDVPDAARDRLGMLPGQDNVLLRVVLRPIDRTMTADEANALRDRIYDAVHEGERTVAVVG